MIYIFKSFPRVFSVWIVFLLFIHENAQANIAIHGKYVLQSFETPVTKIQAEERCKQTNGWLVRIKDATLNSAVATSLRSGNYWIGLMEDGNFSPRKWKWNDGSYSTYFLWGPAQPNSRAEDCVVIATGNDKWYDIRCSAIAKFICQRDPCSPNPCQNNGICEMSTNHPYYNCECKAAYEGSKCSDPKYYIDGICKYHINYENQMNFADSVEACANLGGSLVMIKNKETNDFIAQSANESYFGISPVHLRFGGTRRDGIWRWLDGTLIPQRRDSGYQIWETHRPKQDPEFDCIYMSNYFDTVGIKDTYVWADTTCINPIGFICEISNSPTNPCFGNLCSDHGTCISVGCHWKCNCSTGYWGQFCENEQHPAKKDLIVFSGQKATVRLITQSATGTIVLKIYNETNSPIETAIFKELGNIILSFGPIYEKSEGVYTIVAINSSYVSRLTFNIKVHVNATITRLIPTTISSPVTIGSNNVTCAAGGNPPPHVNWLRNGDNITTSSNASVYQIIGYLQSELVIANAVRSDEGTYSCQTVNYVGETGEESIEEKKITLSVFRPPKLISVQNPDCSENIQLNITWMPNNQATANYRFTFVSQNLSHVEEVKEYNAITSINEEQVLSVNNLSQLATYNITISVCPDICIDGFSQTTLHTTGTGLLGPINGADVHSNKSTCHISWSWESTAITSGFEITLKAVLVYQVNDENIFTQNEYPFVEKERLPSKDRKTTINMLPNREYSVYIGAVNCAGVGPLTKANGTCISDRAAPYVVPAAVIGSKFSGNTREISITLPNESNGPISCLFVVLKPSRNFTRHELTTENPHSITDKNSSHLAVAIQRSMIQQSVFTVTLGDNSVTSCKLNSSKDEEVLLYQAKNIPLKTGEIYYYYIVTATPTDYSGIQYQNGEISSFKNMEKDDSNNAWMPGLIALATVLIIGASVFLYCKKCRKINEDKANGTPVNGTSATQSCEEIEYENVQLDENRIYQEIK